MGIEPHFYALVQSGGKFKEKLQLQRNGQVNDARISNDSVDMHVQIYMYMYFTELAKIIHVLVVRFIHVHVAMNVNSRVPNNIWKHKLMQTEFQTVEYLSTMTLRLTNFTILHHTLN